MKIFYAVQATGNGHISRANTILPYLRKYGDVDVFLSGSNYGLQSDLPVKFRSKGISLEYNQSIGSIDIFKTINNVKFISLYREVRSLPVEKYDLILNDFEPLTSLACYFKGVPSIHFGHQASFTSTKVPRPSKKDLIGELILSKYVQSSKTVGLHFKKYDKFIYPPILKEKILRATPIDKGHITVYVAQYGIDYLINILSKIKSFSFHLFHPTCTTIRQEGNIKIYPIHKDFFDESLLTCHGIITGAGFETPAEALYLNKRLMVVPIKGQYEQQCNAEALKVDFNVVSIPAIDAFFPGVFLNWINEMTQNPLVLHDTTAEVIKNVMS